MASAHIELDSSARLGGKLRSFVDSYTAIRNNADDLKAVFDQLALGGDYAALGAALGLTGGSAAANAEAIYNLLGSLVTEQNSATFTAQLLSRLG